MPQLQKYLTEHVTLFFSYVVIILLGRTVTLAPPHGEESGIICGPSPVKTSNYWQFWQPASLQIS